MNFFETFYDVDSVLMMTGLYLYFSFELLKKLNGKTKNFLRQVRLSSLLALLQIWQTVLCIILDKSFILSLLTALGWIYIFIKDYKQLNIAIKKENNNNNDK